jgi:hypothetical protein
VVLLLVEIGYNIVPTKKDTKELTFSKKSKVGSIVSVIVSILCSKHNVVFNVFFILYLPQLLSLCTFYHRGDYLTSFPSWHAVANVVEHRHKGCQQPERPKIAERGDKSV